jgi:hypothetical protein
MAESTDLQDRYALILEQFAQEMRSPPGARNRRAAPRVPVTTKDIHAVVSDLGVTADVGVETKDISTTGVCFFADRPFQIGTEVDLRVSKVFSLTAAVVSCEMEETDANLLEVRYRVCCKFCDPHHGMELLVLAKESEMVAEEPGADVTRFPRGSVREEG